MTTLTIWHNPRCSKSRMALTLLEEHGALPTQVKYLETPPTENEIREVLRLLGIPAIDLVRRGESTFKELNLSPTAPESQLINAMATHPILIERPIIISGAEAVIGRPPENALKLLSWLEWWMARKLSESSLRIKATKTYTIQMNSSMNLASLDSMIWKMNTCLLVYIQDYLFGCI